MKLIDEKLGAVWVLVITLQAFQVINWSWWIVLFPLVITLFVFVFAVIIAILTLLYVWWVQE